MNKSEKQFLPKKYGDLPGSKPVERAVAKKMRRGEKGASTREERVEAYLDRLEDLIKDPRAFSLLKHKVLERYTTKPEEIPKSYWLAQEKTIRERGEAGDWAQATDEQKEELKAKHAETVLHDQRASLEQWLDYFGSPDSDYIPKNLKYWIFRNIIGLSEYDKKQKKFPKRSKGTVNPFPDINYEALSYVVDAIAKKLKGENIEFEYDIQEADQQAFQTALKKENFAKLYAWANEMHNPIPEHLLPVTQGEWVKYEQNSEPDKLIKTIRGRGTGWCTAGENTARTQLQGGDFWVYYSLDDEGKPTIPRLAIRMQGQNEIAEEPRGVAYKQNVDPYMNDILEAKLEEMGPAAEAYKKKSADMKKLTNIETKAKFKIKLEKEDLEFLYEINNPIEGFGYQKDPRIAELRKGRDPEEDMLTIFECTPNQIAHHASEINKNTKAYLGKLEPGVFNHGLEHVYTSFPEGKILQYHIEIGGKSKKQLEKELQAKNIWVSDLAEELMKSKDFRISKKAEKAGLVRLTVKDLGFDDDATTDEIFQRAEDLGLDLCPAEVGPHLRLQYSGKEWMNIGMKQITARDGFRFVFLLTWYGDRPELDASYAGPSYRWDPGSRFVFRLRKLES